MHIRVPGTTVSIQAIAKVMVRVVVVKISVSIVLVEFKGIQV